jgi:hypothetical protein
MGLFDSAKDKISDLAGDNQDKIADGVDQAGDAVDDKTGGKFSDQVDTGQDAAKGKLGDL